jgi:hypothetical protein
MHMSGQLQAPAILVQGKASVYLLAMRLDELNSSLQAVKERKALSLLGIKIRSSSP